MTQTSYTAKDITVLEGLEPVRLRPGMYIGSTGSRGLHHLVYEVVDNAVDEALGGHNDTVEVTIHPDNSVTVVDEGRGIPVGIVEGTGLPALTVVLTKLHAGGKFGGDGYKVSGGLHGVGVSVVNALSEWLIADVHMDGTIYRQEFERGEPKYDMKEIGPTDRTGTTISFLPDKEVFEEVDFAADTLAQRLRETAFLTRGLRIKLVDERAEGTTVEFHYEGGIRDFVEYVNAAKDPVHKRIVYFEGESDQGAVEVAMQWNSSYQDSVYTFANNINTHEGGTHLSGFKAALTGTLNRVARQMTLLKEKEENLDGEDVREGLAAVISVKLRDPQFEGQTKTKLGNPGIRGLVEQTVNEKLAAVLRGEPDRGASGDQQGDPGLARAPGGAQGARAHAPQERARELVAAGQARRLPDQRPLGRGALPRRGQLGRRLGRRRARPPLPGDPAAARQGDQLREEPDQQGALERRDPGDHHGDRHGHRRGVRPREAALPPRDRDDGRRRRRLAHPHADPDVPVPADAGAGRERPHLHRRAAAVPRQDRQSRAVRREGSASRRAARARADQGLRRSRPHAARRRS